MVTLVNDATHQLPIHDEGVVSEKKALELRRVLYRLNEVERDSMEWEELINELADTLAQQAKMPQDQRATQAQSSAQASQALVGSALLIEKG